MTEKDPRDMTASELLRKADSHPCSMCHMVLDDDGSCSMHGCAEWAYKLADKIDAELAEAQGAVGHDWLDSMAECYGWPRLRENEPFREWMARCWLPRPRFEDGAPVQFGDWFIDAGGERCKVTSLGMGFDGKLVVNPMASDEDDGIEIGPGERVERPAPEVLLADGLPAKVGETVWTTETGWEATVDGFDGELVVLHWVDRGHIDQGVLPDKLTHTPPVTAADGKPLAKGETVWLTDEGAAHVNGNDPDVYSLYHVAPNEALVVNSPLKSGKCVHIGDYGAWCPASWLTHDEPDTLTKIEEDAVKDMVKYWGCGLAGCIDCPAEIDGQAPAERYGTGGRGTLSCRSAASLDLLARQRAVIARGGAE